jgi:hypothetical protein
MKILSPSQAVPEPELKRRLAFDNPWWEQGQVPQRFREWPRRSYFEGFWSLFRESSVRRATIVLGPRRVGKTVMLTQAVQALIDGGVDPKRVLYVSLDTPAYLGLWLDRLLRLFMEMHGHDRNSRLFVIFDEIQYLDDWAVHLKSMVDSYDEIRFAASGSAAAALKLKGRESGAGRFTDFVLPPLGFGEYLQFRGDEGRYFSAEGALVADIPTLNGAFRDYVAYGGFPEPARDAMVQVAIDRFLASDIVERVVLGDLPALYGIGDPTELKRLLTWVAFNTGAEISYEKLAMSAGVAKNTLRKYLEFLEAAFLVVRLPRIDQSARRFQRATFFKLYLANPTLRTALFGPIGDDDPAMGRLAETAFFAQLAQTRYAGDAYYARWDRGEVDCVLLDRGTLRAWEALEIKWSDRAAGNPGETLSSLVEFCKRNRLARAVVATKSAAARLTFGEIELELVPLALCCYRLGKRFVLEGMKRQHPHFGLAEPDAPPFGMMAGPLSALAAEPVRVL